MEMNQSIQTPATAFYGPLNPTNRSNNVATNNYETWIIEPQVTYTRKLAKGKLVVLVGSTIQRNMTNTIAQSASGFASDALISDVALASSQRISGYGSSDYRYNALFARLSYNWQDKYLLNATARRDGSSRFGPGNQFGNFGAVGAAWIFSHEKFIEDHLPFLSFGKLRASYGTTGNDQISDYQYLSTYSAYTPSAYQGVTGLYPTLITNPYFGWELAMTIVPAIFSGIETDFQVIVIISLRSNL